MGGKSKKLKCKTAKNVPAKSKAHVSLKAKKSKKVAKLANAKERNIFTLQLSKTTIENIDALLLQTPLTADETGDDLLLQREIAHSSHESPPVRLNNMAKRRVEVPPKTAKINKFRHFRKKLPIYTYRQQILDAISSNPVIVISGETGSGKTTQVPQYILEECEQRKTGCKIICTQPRRLAATSIAERVSQERHDQLGRSVGYRIRFDSCVSPTTNLIFMTSGFLLRCLTSGGELFNSCTHLILDEVHERESITDFLLIAIRNALPTQPNLKVILMSATLDSEMFCKYFNECPLINVPGRSYPVDSVYLGELLHLTGYRTKNMEKYMRANGGPKLKESGNVISSASTKNGAQSLMAVQTPEVSEDDAQFYDECLDACLTCEEESAFEQIFYMISCEKMPANYKHSERSLTALEISTAKGLDGVVKRLIELGAVTEKANDVTANGLAQLTRDVHPTNPVDVEKAEYEKAMQTFLSATYRMFGTNDKIDSNLLITVIEHIHTNRPYDGAILVFLPGYRCIITAKNMIEVKFAQHDYQLFVLHSNMQNSSQSDDKRVFHRMPHGVRKIILATNIAETSLTIEDVVYVVDAGKVNLTSYDSLSDTTSLSLSTISQACAKQRAGRAGRTRRGICYRLYSIEEYEAMDKFTLPDLLRIPLPDLCLKAKMLASTIPIEEYLLKALQPPPVINIRHSIDLLKRIDVLDQNENVTQLGGHLADFPVDVQYAKCILYAVLLRCVDPIVTIISALSSATPFKLPFNNNHRKIDAFKKKLAKDTFSDHMVLLNVYNEWQCRYNFNGKQLYCDRNDISNPAMEAIHGLRMLIMRHLNETCSLSDIEFNVNEYSKKWCVIKACLTAGLYPQSCCADGKALVSKTKGKVTRDQSSIWESNLENIGLNWIIYGERTKPPTKKSAFIRNISPVSSVCIALFSGHINLPDTCIETIQSSPSNSDDDSGLEDKSSSDINSTSSLVYFSLDDWLVFRTSQHYAKSVYNIRCKLNAIFVKMLKSIRLFTPTLADKNVLDTVVNILETEEYSKHKFISLGAIKNPIRNSMDSISDSLNERIKIGTESSKNASRLFVNLNDRKSVSISALYPLN